MKNKINEPEYKLWASIKRRCFPSENQYTKEEEVGMHPEWVKDYDKFKKDVGNKPTKDHYFVRIDTTKGFTPDNVKWTTKKPGNNVHKYYITYNNIKESVKYWSRVTGISYLTLLQRKKARWEDKDIIEIKPVSKRKRQKTDI